MGNDNLSNSGIDNENQDLQKRQVQQQVRDIWKRARTNAFAHKAAMERNRKKSYEYNGKDFLFGLLGMVFTVLLLLISTNEAEKLLNGYKTTILVSKMVITLISIGCGAFALYASSKSNTHQYEARANEHEWLLGAYQYIAQRARAVRWPGMDLEEMIYILRTNEEAFQLLKARGSEPSHEDFEIAHETMDGILADPKTASMQSFNKAFEEEPNTADSQ